MKRWQKKYLFARREITVTFRWTRNKLQLRRRFISQRNRNRMVLIGELFQQKTTGEFASSSEKPVFVSQSTNAQSNESTVGLQNTIDYPAETQL